MPSRVPLLSLWPIIDWRMKGVKTPHQVTQDGIEGKHCSTGHWKPLAAFGKDRSSWAGLQRLCQQCKTTHERGWYKKNAHKRRPYERTYRRTPAHIFSVIVNSAKKRNIPVEFNKEPFVWWWRGTPDQCHYCDITAAYLSRMWPEIKSARNRLSVDRLDNSKGYTSGNIVKACFVCNHIKRDLFTADEVKRHIVPAIHAIAAERFKLSDSVHCTTRPPFLDPRL